VKNSFATRKWRRRAIFLFLPTFLLAWRHVAAQTQTSFADLANHVAEQPAIGSMVNQGIMHGVSPTEFNPDAPMTNSDFAASVQKMFNLPVPAEKTNFTDVPESSAAYNAVEAVAPYLGRQIICFQCQLGTNFGPNEPASRLLAAVAMTNVLLAQKKVTLLTSDAAETALANVPDAATLQGPARVYVATAMQQGILTLTAQHTIDALSPMSRVDTAVQFDAVQKKFNLPLVQVP
jgi:hypothetical protein